MNQKLILNISGKIDLSTYNYVLNQIHNNINANTEIVLIINSGGGNVCHGFAIHDALSILPNPITTVAIGTCHSIATILFSLGKERYCSPNSSYLLHGTQQHLDNAFLSQKDAKELAKSLEKDNSKIINALMKMNNLKLTKGQLKKYFSSGEDYLFDAHQLIELGIATDIIEDITTII